MKYCPKFTYPDDLPIIQKKKEICTTIKENQIVIIAGETGSGKTTQIPKFFLELGYGIKKIIGHTQPRRLAAKTIAHRISKELNVKIGTAVGYKIRFHDNTSDNTLIKLMTDGILLSELCYDKLLLQYEVLIIDESHERSLNIDFIFGYLHQIIPKRPDLKVIITSATIDLYRFSNYFNRAPIIEVSGRKYPVEIKYRPFNKKVDRNKNQITAITSAIDEINKENRGNILIFLSGEREITDTLKALNTNNYKNTEILPLFSRLSSAKQNIIFKKNNKKRIILATNIAETSLTVPGIKYVIDTGYARINRYSHKKKIQRLKVEPISKASANQRTGRCGRISPGICIRLYSEEDFFSRPMFTDPEIFRSNLASVILQMFSIGLTDINKFNFIDVPDNKNIKDGIRLLEELQAIISVQEKTKKTFKLTSIGEKIAKFPLDPRLARMILESQKYECVHEVIIISAALSVQDPRERPLYKQQFADKQHSKFSDSRSDFMTFLNLWNFCKEQKLVLSDLNFIKKCKSYFLNLTNIKEWIEVYNQILTVANNLGIIINNKDADYNSIHISLLSGFLSNIGKKNIYKNNFLSVKNISFVIFPYSILAKKNYKWIMVSELIETNKIFGRVAAEIRLSWIEKIAQHLLKYTYSLPYWSKKKQAVIALENIKLFNLPIIINRKFFYDKIDPILCHEIFIKSALIEGQWKTNHTFYEKNLEFLKKIRAIENKLRQNSVIINDDTIFNFYNNRIDKIVVSSKHFDKWWEYVNNNQPNLLTFTKKILINDSKYNINILDYPDYWYQNKFQLKLNYEFNLNSISDGVTVDIPLLLLNEIQDKYFDWQIPGWREQLIITLIKSLPKKIRCCITPISRYVKSFLMKYSVPQGKLLHCLEKSLFLNTGISIKYEDWNLTKIPSYLKIKFKIIDEKNNAIAVDSSLLKLKVKFKEDIQKKLSVIFNHIKKSGLRTWNFVDFPKNYKQYYSGYLYSFYPALIDEKKSVGIDVFTTENEQKQSMLTGLTRLLLINIPSQITKKLNDKILNSLKYIFYFNPYSNILYLIEDCIIISIDKLIDNFGGIVWTKKDYNTLQIYINSEITNMVFDIVKQVQVILTQVYHMYKKLKNIFNISFTNSLIDIKSHLSELIFDGFIKKYGWRKLYDIQRYISGISYRFKKLVTNYHYDIMCMTKIQDINKKWQKVFNNLSIKKQLQPEVQEIYWMIEELKISLYAQSIKTKYTISDKRIIEKMNKFF